MSGLPLNAEIHQQTPRKEAIPLETYFPWFPKTYKPIDRTSKEFTDLWLEQIDRENLNRERRKSCQKKAFSKATKSVK